MVKNFISAALFQATLLALSSLPSVAQTPVCNVRENRFCADVSALAARTDVIRAFSWIDNTDDRALADLILLTEIPAPPFAEEPRARAFADMLRDAGADSVWTDEVGNVLALRRGRTGGRTVALAGHMDTVFPEGTDVTVTQRGDTLFAPGIGDDTRGLIVVLTALRALEASGIETRDDLLFVGTVGEEGLGDLRGVKHLFRDNGPRVDAFVAIDGGDDDQVTNGALGSRRYRVQYDGPGGHSWSAFGGASPIHALGRAIAMFDDEATRFTARGPRTSYNVGRIGGGTSVNSIAFEAWLEVDMRSEDRTRLMAIDSIFREVARRALREENAARRDGEPLTMQLDLVGDRPSGMTDPTSPLALRAMAATGHFGDLPELRISSTDSNIPISMGVPAITLGRGGISGHGHAPDEFWVNVNSTLAIKRALLILLADAGTAGPTT